MLAAIDTAAWVAIIAAIGAVLLNLLGTVLNYMGQRKLTAVTQKTAAVTEQTAEVAKQAATVGQKTNEMVNGGKSLLLIENAASLKRIASLTDDPVDHSVAATAAKIAIDHQAMMEATQTPKGP